jgi:two-component system response regulator MprA
MSARVLLVDDDQGVLSSLRRALALEGYEVRVAEDGEMALQAASNEHLDLVVLDVMLPGIDGFTVCERIRRTQATPILMLTAKDTVPDRVSGLDRGADDYLVKPFVLDELLARIRALLRRGQGHPEEVLEYGGISLNTQTREVLRDGELLNLTPHQHELLEVFLRHPRQALSRDRLCQSVWGYSFEGESNFVDVAVKELRKKLEADGYPRLIQTVRGYGYALRED